MYKNVKRYAGASAGAMTASLLAVGYNSYEIEEFLSQDLSKIFLGKITVLCDILTTCVKGKQELM